MKQIFAFLLFTAIVFSAVALAQSGITTTPSTPLSCPDGVNCTFPGTVSVGNAVIAASRKPQPVSMEFWFGGSAKTPTPVSAVTISGMRTAMATPYMAVQCLDANRVNVGCTVGFSANSYNPHYSDVAVTLPGPSVGSVIISGVQRFTFYVDSISGLDANNGTSAMTPLMNITALPGLAAGNTVGLAANSWWRQQLSLVSNTSAFGYGIGSQPLLDGSDVIPSGDWSLKSGCTNTYQATEAIYVDTGGYVNLYENNSPLPRVALSSGCLDTAPGSMNVSADSGATTAIYVNPVGATNPTSDGNLYEYTHREEGLGTDAANNATVFNIATRRNFDQTGSLGLGNGAIVQRVTASDGSKHNIDVGEGSTISYSTATGAYGLASVLTSGSMYIGYCETAINSCTGAPVEFRYNAAIADPAYQTFNGGFYAHTSGSTTYSYVLFDHLTSTGCGAGFAGAGNTTASYLTNLVGDAYITAAGTSIIDTVTLKIPYASQYGIKVGTGATAAITNANIATLGTSSYPLCLTTGAAVTISNSILDTENTNSAPIYSTGTTTINMSYTTLYAWSGYNLMSIGAGATLTSNNNQFSSSRVQGCKGSANFAYLGTSYTSFATYKSASSQDAATISCP